MKILRKEKFGRGEEIVEVWEKDPSIHAFTDLMNRALDKPKEQVLELNVESDTAAMDKEKIGRGEEIVEVWEKDPSIHAFADLMNRALDKPKEQVLELSIEGDIVARLIEGRKRVAEAAVAPDVLN